MRDEIITLQGKQSTRVIILNLEQFNKHDADKNLRL